MSGHRSQLAPALRKPSKEPGRTDACPRFRSFGVRGAANATNDEGCWYGPVQQQQAIRKEIVRHLVLVLMLSISRSTVIWSCFYRCQMH